MTSIPVLGWSQVVIGSIIALGGYLLLVFCVDQHTPALRKWLIRGLSVWGAWFAMTPFTSAGADSISAQALALLVAMVLVVHGRRIRGILDNEDWWEAGRAGRPVTAHFEESRSIPWRQRLNLRWAFLAADDGSYQGPSDWNPDAFALPGIGLTPFVMMGRVVQIPCLQWRRIERSVSWSWWRTWQWGAAHFGHNFTNYVIGVAGRERLIEGRYAPRDRSPNEGWLTCVTHVQIAGRFVSLPFVSFHGSHCDFQAMWHPSGAFTLRFHRFHAGQEEAPI